jgi:hypothetical protein
VSLRRRPSADGLNSNCRRRSIFDAESQRTPTLSWRSRQGAADAGLGRGEGNIIVEIRQTEMPPTS